jgi:hypothetical protein
MKKLMILFVLLTGFASPVSALEYDYKNGAHKGDKECIAILSIMRDGTFQNGLTEEYKLLTELQNKLILKYDYSPQLNNHVDAFKMYAKQMIANGTDITDAAVACIARAELSS